MFKQNSHKIFDLCQKDALNILVGENRPDHIETDMEFLPETGTTPEYRRPFVRHPEETPSLVADIVDLFFECDNYVILASNRYITLKEAELIAREGDLNINWVICDGESPESYNQTRMPENSVLDHSADMFERDLRVTADI